MRHLLLLASILAGATPATAHDFWIQPSRFWVAPAASVPFTIQVGHGTARQRSPIPAERIIVFRSYASHEVVDRRSSLHVGQAASDADLTFATPGTHLVVFATNNTISNLPAIRYNDFAKAEGLTEVVRFRAANNTNDAPGREFYSRRAKSLVQVGPPGRTAQPQVTRAVGLDLEIVPEHSPYAVSSDAEFPVHVFYHGRSLAGALVKLNDLQADDKPVETHLTDQAGRAIFRAHRQGEWQMNVVWSTPITTTRVADFLTTFSSLTFGFPVPTRAN